MAASVSAEEKAPRRRGIAYRVGGDVQGGDEQEPLGRLETRHRMAREQRGQDGHRAEGEHGRPERPAGGRALGRIAQAPEQVQREEGQRGLGEA